MESKTAFPLNTYLTVSVVTSLKMS